MQIKWKSVEMFLIEHYDESKGTLKECEKGIIVMEFKSHMQERLNN